MRCITGVLEEHTLREVRPFGAQPKRRDGEANGAPGRTEAAGRNEIRKVGEPRHVLVLLGDGCHDFRTGSDSHHVVVEERDETTQVANASREGRRETAVKVHGATLVHGVTDEAEKLRLAHRNKHGKGIGRATRSHTETAEESCRFAVTQRTLVHRAQQYKVNAAKPLGQRVHGRVTKLATRSQRALPIEQLALTRVKVQRQLVLATKARELRGDTRTSRSLQHGETRVVQQRFHEGRPTKIEAPPPKLLLDARDKALPGRRARKVLNGVLGGEGRRRGQQFRLQVRCART